MSFHYQPNLRTVKDVRFATKYRLMGSQNWHLLAVHPSAHQPIPWCYRVPSAFAATPMVFDFLRSKRRLSDLRLRLSCLHHHPSWRLGEWRHETWTFPRSTKMQILGTPPHIPSLIFHQQSLFCSLPLWWTSVCRTMSQYWSTKDLP